MIFLKIYLRFHELLAGTFVGGLNTVLAFLAGNEFSVAFGFVPVLYFGEVADNAGFADDIFRFAGRAFFEQSAGLVMAAVAEDAGKRTPSAFVGSIIGRPVQVKLNSGVTYKGILAGLDGFMNLAMEQTESRPSSLYPRSCLDSRHQHLHFVEPN